MGHGSFDLSHKTLSNNDEKKKSIFLFLTTLIVELWGNLTNETIKLFFSFSAKQLLT